MSDDLLADWIELLCGQAPTPTKYSSELIRHFPKGGLGRSQLNEILLAYQLDRIGEGLFEFIFGNEPIQDFETFKTKISEFRIFGAVHCGNFKFAYKSLRQRSLKEIRDIFRLDEPDPETAFRKRHPPVVALNEIDPKDTYYLGYIIERQLKEHPDEGASKRMMEIREKGAINHEIYLDYDHLDVYIATSMREKFDFWNIARFARELQCREEIGAPK